MPPTIVRNTIGPMSIFIELTKVVPMGSMAIPAVGASQPTRMPKRMAVSTQKYSCRYQRVFGAAFLTDCVLAGAAAAAVM